MKFPALVRGLLCIGLTLPPSLDAQDPTSSTEEWSPAGLTEVYRFTDSIGTAALLIVSDGQVIASRGRVSHPFRAHSMRKSILSALIGMAVDRNQIDTTATLADLGIDDLGELTSTELQATVLQLLEARSGVYHPAASETPEMSESRPRRGSHRPGEHWYYNNWDFNTLGAIYSEGTGRSVGDAFVDEIARPLGMEDFDVREHFRYQLEAEHSRHPSYKFRFSARDLARFGQLFLHRGVWDGERLLSEAWIDESTRAHSATNQSGTKSGFGLMWWVTRVGQEGLPTGSFSASGSGGQRVTIFPDIDTVLVHLMDTDLDDGPSIGTSTYNELVRRVRAAHRQ